MSDTRVTIRCETCSFAAGYDSLRRARAAVAEHRADTGHSVEWTIDRLASGVERAGADAGVCGRPDCANEDSPLVRGGADRTDDDEREIE